MSTIPTDEQMKEFRDKLEKMGPEEAQRKLNKKNYLPDYWQTKEINSFIQRNHRYKEELYQQAIISLQKERNTISWVAIGISLLALLVSGAAIVLDFN